MAFGNIPCAATRPPVPDTITYMADLPYQTLHCHTTASDGTLTHREVLDICAQNRIGVVAFTDHDSLAKPATLERLKALNHPVKFISGIEISANTVAEVSEPISLFHIVGLFVDPTNRELLENNRLAITKRRERAERIVVNLQSLGLKISLGEIEKLAAGEAIGRAHIAKAILARETNLRVIDQLLAKLALETDPQWQKLYQQTLAHEYYQRIFDLFLDDKSYIQGVYVHYLHPVSLDKAVSLIRNAGGLAVLAHWSFYKRKVTADLLEKLMAERRVDGAETTYGFGMLADPAHTLAADMALVTKLVKKYELIPAGGGDFHRPEEFTAMQSPENMPLAQNTCGLVEKIFARHPRLDRTWSSF
jgi:3',5'-nucleoside bisphosphate phosphatase